MKKGQIGYPETSVNYQHISCTHPRRAKASTAPRRKSEISHEIRLFRQGNFSRSVSSFDSRRPHTAETVSSNADFMGPFLTPGSPHDFTLKGEGKRKTVKG
jgi:hypothetical protein